MSKRQRNLRTKTDWTEEGPSNEEKADDDIREKMMVTKLAQKQRKRVVGLDAAALISGSATEGDDGNSQLPPELMESYVHAKAAKEDTEEDPHMQQFIEDQLAARLGKRSGQALAEDPHEAHRRRKEEELYSVPDEFKTTLAPDVMLPGLITGITEVPLPLDARLRNIEETEGVKRNMLARSSRRAGMRGGDEDDEARRRRDAERFAPRRGMFASSFGKAPSKGDTPPPSDAAARGVDGKKEKAASKEYQRFIRAPKESRMHRP